MKTIFETTTTRASGSISIHVYKGAPEPTVKNGVIYHPYKWPYKRVIGAISSL